MTAWSEPFTPGAPEALYFLAHRSKDAEEDIEMWRAGILQHLATPGWNIGMDTGKEVVQLFINPDSGKPNWKEFTPYPTSMLPPLCQTPRYQGFIVPLHGVDGPTLRLPFLGRATAEMLDRAFTMEREGLCTRYNYAAEYLGGDPSIKDAWKLRRIYGTDPVNGKRNFARWALMDFRDPGQSGDVDGSGAFTPDDIPY